MTAAIFCEPNAKSDDTDRVNLLLCTNSLYLQHVAVCLASLLSNNPELYFRVLVVSRTGEVLDESKLIRSLSFAENHSLSFRQFTPPVDRIMPLNPRAHYTLDIWTRLWVAELFEVNVDRVLYLDCDVVVVGDIRPLWTTDLEGALLGAVDIPGSQRGVQNLGMRPEDGYFNSGVLLFDLDQWRKTCALDTVLDYVSANLERLHDPDQDALNACFHARRKRLDYKWNLIRPFYRDPPVLPLSIEEIEAARKDVRTHSFQWLAEALELFLRSSAKSAV